MGQIVTNVQYNQGTKVLSGDAVHDTVLDVYFDDANDRLMQGDHTPTAGRGPAKASTVTVDRKGKWTYDTTSLSLSVGAHTVRFRNASGANTLRIPFTV